MFQGEAICTNKLASPSRDAPAAATYCPEKNNPVNACTGELRKIKWTNSQEVHHGSCQQPTPPAVSVRWVLRKRAQLELFRERPETPTIPMSYNGPSDVMLPAPLVRVISTPTGQRAPPSIAFCDVGPRAAATLSWMTS